VLLVHGLNVDLNTYEFLLAAQPFDIPVAIGSPLNPVAIK
jgi:hypothetical protein